jgi:hypothetical protein
MDCIHLIISSETTEIHHLSMLVNTRKQIVVLKRQLIGKHQSPFDYPLEITRGTSLASSANRVLVAVKPSPVRRCDTQVGTELGTTPTTQLSGRVHVP